MPTDTASFQVTATIVPAMTSGAEAIRAARQFAASIADGAIERDRSGQVPARELAVLGSPEQRRRHDPVSWKYHHIGNYLLNDILPPSHGQI